MFVLLIGCISLGALPGLLSLSAVCDVLLGSAFWLSRLFFVLLSRGAAPVFGLVFAGRPRFVDCNFVHGSPSWLAFLARLVAAISAAWLHFSLFGSRGFLVNLSPW